MQALALFVGVQNIQLYTSFVAAKKVSLNLNETVCDFVLSKH
jgi:hypothetical protein